MQASLLAAMVQGVVMVGREVLSLAPKWHHLPTAPSLNLTSLAAEVVMASMVAFLIQVS